MKKLITYIVAVMFLLLVPTNALFMMWWSNRIKVVFNLGTGGTTTDKTIFRIKRNEEMPMAPSVVCKSGYEFVGWTSDDNCNYTLYEDITFTAQYRQK